MTWRKPSGAKQKERAAGRRAQSNGQRAEAAVAAACRRYFAEGVADIRKRPEPYRQLGPCAPGGQFRAVRIKASGADFQGVMRGGRAIRFDVKSSGLPRLPLSTHGRPVVSDALAADLESAERLGAVSGLLVRIAAPAGEAGPFVWYWLHWPDWRNAVAQARADGAASLSHRALSMYGHRVPLEGGAPRLICAAAPEVCDG